MAENFTRREQTFHDNIWAMANESSGVERAMSDARHLCYAILDETEEGSAAHFMATQWLEQNGRDRLKEGVPYENQ